MDSFFIFQRKVKEAFEKVKEHITSLEAQIKQNNDVIEKLRENFNSPKEQQISKDQEKPKFDNLPLKNDNSNRNKGVYSFIHSFAIHSFTDYSFNNKEVDRLISRLSSQEFLTFLTIYQLEDDIKTVTYSNVAQQINLSEGCIRTYISSLIKKGMPIIKTKHNNKQVLLSVSPEFRSLNLKEKLIDFFYKTDPHQRRLSDTF